MEPRTVKVGKQAYRARIIPSTDDTQFLVEILLSASPYTPYVAAEDHGWHPSREEAVQVATKRLDNLELRPKPDYERRFFV